MAPPPRALLPYPGLRPFESQEADIFFGRETQVDAMVMVYADNAGWARAQLRAFLKLTPRRERLVRAIPVIDAPADPKPALNFMMPEMVIIDGRNGIGPEVLTRLCEALRL